MTAPDVLLLSSIDPVLRETTAAGLLCDLPDALVLRHDLLPDGLRRVVYGSDGVREDELVALDHSCLSCALREDVLPAVQRLLTSAAPSALVLALPVAAEPLPVLRALLSTPSRRFRMGPLLAAVDAPGLVDDLLGDDLLCERGLALTDEDTRAVGEALVHQIEVADVILVSEPPSGQADALLEHLAPTGARREVLHRARLVADAPNPLVAGEGGRREHLLRRGDPRRLPASSSQTRDGVWTLDLRSWRPMHPVRLLAGIETLGAGPVRGRGCFWLPTRPEVVVAWDGAGGQLSIGGIGSWRAQPAAGRPERGTRLLITGVDGDGERRRQGFESMLMTDSELASGLERWAGRPDGFDAWLGPLEDVA